MLCWWLSYYSICCGKGYVQATVGHIACNISKSTYLIYEVNLIKMIHVPISEHPLFFHEELQNLEAVAGKTATFCCRLSKPGLPVQWKKEAVVLKPGNKYEMNQNECELHLKIQDLTNHDRGTYKCCTGGIVTTAFLEVKGMCNTFLVSSCYVEESINKAKIYKQARV